MEKKAKKKLSNRFIKNLFIAIVMLVIAAGLLAVWFVFRPNNQTTQHEVFSIERISELSTIKARYHNVAIRNDQGNFLTYGKQYVWFEYDVDVEAGIDVSQISIEQPTEDGIVRIYLPPAQIHRVSEVEESISKPVHSTGFLTKLTAEDERQIINEGNSKLKEDVKTQEVISLAYANAKEFIEQYVANVGNLMGTTYTVEWIENPSSN